MIQTPNDIQTNPFQNIQPESKAHSHETINIQSCSLFKIEIIENVYIRHSWMTGCFTPQKSMPC